jgi:cobalt-zinc-cadmium efflux system outer membrane protein
MIAALFVLAVLAPAPTLELGEVLRDVADRAPLVEVGSAEADVARAQVGVAGAWDDASLSVMGESIPLPGGMTEEPIMIEYRLSQPLNLFGRRRLAKQAARADVEVATARLRRTSWNARAQAVGLFYELWMNGERRRIVAAQISVLERMRDAALARVRAGMDMGHHDVLRADAEIASMEAERASLADERAAIVAMLNALRGRPADEHVGEPVLPAVANLPALRAVVARSGQAPEVTSARAMGAAARARVDLARRMYWPMVMVDVGYQQKLDGMPDGLLAGVSLTVPLAWRDRQRNEVAMARTMVRAADVEVSSMKRMAEAELQMAWSRARAAERAVAVLESTALPRLRETIASIEAAYASGQGGFLSLLDAVMQLQELELRRVAAVAARGVARFELDRIAGVEVTR